MTAQQKLNTLINNCTKPKALQQLDLWAGRFAQEFNTDEVVKTACLEFLQVKARYYEGEILTEEFNKLENDFWNKYYSTTATTLTGTAALASAATMSTTTAASTTWHAAYWANRASVEAGYGPAWPKLYSQALIILKGLPDCEETHLLFG